MGNSAAGSGSDNDNRDPEIVSVLIRISKKTRTVLGLRLAEIGLATGEDDLLLTLPVGQSWTIDRLSSELSVRGPTIRRAVERLAARGLIEQLTNSLVRLTGQGVSIQPRIVAVHQRIAGDIARTIDVDRLMALTAELNDLDACLSRSLTKMI